MNSQTVVDRVIDLFNKHGSSQYGGEAVTQAEHGLQAATHARKLGLAPCQVAAALLHDIGHLLHHFPDDAPSKGIDDQHEELGAAWLEKYFKPEVVEAVRMHVSAKRYLCSREPDYFESLSQPSVLSLKLQGGPMNETECGQFEKHRFFREAVALRKLDELAKDPLFKTPEVEDFKPELEAALLVTKGNRP